MTFAQVLTQLRREKGLSQEQLADLMDVSRQAVSKWEAGQSMPDLTRLVALAELFGVSLDALVRPDRAGAAAACPEEAQIGTAHPGSAYSSGAQTGAAHLGAVHPEAAAPHSKAAASAFAAQAVPAAQSGAAREPAAGPAAGMVRVEAQGRTFYMPAGSVVAITPGYEYKSERTLFGLPLVHINIGYGLRGAKGVFALGNYAVGVVAVGGFSAGLVGIGGLSAGLLLAFGGVALGGIALGGLAVGGIALGACAVGAYALGAAAVASKAAVGVSALAPVSAGMNESAQFAITDATTLREVAGYLRAAGVPRAIAWLLSLGAA